MHKEYVKEFKIPDDKNEQEKDEELLKNIREVENNLSNMHNNLQFASDDLVDYFTYQIKAEEAKYGYLMKLAKKKEEEK